jgi:predicted metal-dependent HD superfamily phosphohydrolase
MPSPSPHLDDATWAAARGAYAEPHRRYHDLTHLDEVLAAHARLRAAGGWRAPDETALALVFHDVVYVPGALDNERRSAAVARQALRDAPPGLADRVAHLIELTARHGALTPADVADDPDAALMLDVDMAILAAEPTAFARYDAGVAAEYAAVPPALYQAGRRRFVDGLLAKDAIYLSPWGATHLEAPARANLRALAERLAATPAGTSDRAG